MSRTIASSTGNTPSGFSLRAISTNGCGKDGELSAHFDVPRNSFSRFATNLRLVPRNSLYASGRSKVRWHALRVKGGLSSFGDECWEIIRRSLVTDCKIGLASDERQVCNI